MDSKQQERNTMQAINILRIFLFPVLALLELALLIVAALCAVCGWLKGFNAIYGLGQKFPSKDWYFGVHEDCEDIEEDSKCPICPVCHGTGLDPQGSRIHGDIEVDFCRTCDGCGLDFKKL